MCVCVQLCVVYWTKASQIYHISSHPHKCITFHNHLHTFFNESSLRVCPLKSYLAIPNCVGMSALNSVVWCVSPSGKVEVEREGGDGERGSELCELGELHAWQGDNLEDMQTTVSMNFSRV